MGPRIAALGRRILVLLHHDAAAGVLLMLAAAVALLLDNSPLAWLYDAILSTPVAVQVGALSIDKPLLLWINDGLMAVFFFLVGLEIKRELLDGRLSSWNQAALPAAAAVGGMVVPALIYAAFNYDDPMALNGWAIPAATDIAFTLGVLALLGSRVPTALKVFLLALAIIDDLGAIIIIAVFYTADLSLASLAIAAICTAVLLGFNFAGVRRIAPYILVGIIMWVCVLKSGVHATLAGVVIALTVPLRVPPGRRRVTAAQAWSMACIRGSLSSSCRPSRSPTPVCTWAASRLADLLAPIPLGIALGLFAGKQVGVLGFTWVATRVGICRLPEGVSWVQIYGAALLAGIGFTMSLFIGALAFSDPEHASAVRIGVLTGSTLSAVVGYAVLRLSFRPAE